MERPGRDLPVVRLVRLPRGGVDMHSGVRGFGHGELSTEADEGKPIKKGYELHYLGQIIIYLSTLLL